MRIRTLRGVHQDWMVGAGAGGQGTWRGTPSACRAPPPPRRDPYASVTKTETKRGGYFTVMVALAAGAR
jgi:hypothetical protein